MTENYLFKNFKNNKSYKIKLIKAVKKMCNMEIGGDNFTIDQHSLYAKP